MNDDELRDRIARLDPSAADATEPITSPRARALLEDIMNTPDSTSAKPARRPWWPLAGAAAVVALVGVGIAVNAAGGGDDDVAAPIETTAPDPGTTPGKLKVLDLDTGTEDLMAMCIQISPEYVADTQVAFKGTVQSAENGIVTLTIDQAYKGTDAQMATLSAPEGMQALIGGVDFVVGEPYLITATDGVVNYCGFSGPATPELQAIFDQAFPA